ncbi:MAG: hypothetical protein M1357_01710 [Candidatus Marsarchaeota archaeon]|nr:hypothetical protein [Candidatus Marsarchaeota archaeon]
MIVYLDLILTLLLVGGILACSIAIGANYKVVYSEVLSTERANDNLGLVFASCEPLACGAKLAIGLARVGYNVSLTLENMTVTY